LREVAFVFGDELAFALAFGLHAEEVEARAAQELEAR